MYPRPHAHIVPRIRSSSVFEGPPFELLCLPTPNITKVPPLFLGTSRLWSLFSFPPAAIIAFRLTASKLVGTRQTSERCSGRRRINARDPRRKYFSQCLTDKRTLHVPGGSFLTTSELYRPTAPSPNTLFPLSGKVLTSNAPHDQFSDPDCRPPRYRLIELGTNPATPTAALRTTNRADLPSLR